jgi:hypothetical protein
MGFHYLSLILTPQQQVVKEYGEMEVPIVQEALVNVQLNTS